MNENLRSYVAEVAEAVGCEVTKITKLNGTEYLEIIAGSGENIRPRINVQHMYESNLTVDEAIQECKRILATRVPEDFELTLITDFHPNLIFLKLVHQSNADTYNDLWYNLEDWGFYDLIAIPYIAINAPDADGMASVNVSKALLSSWNIDKDELFRLALTNMREDYKIASMSQILSELMAGSYLEDAIPVCPNEIMYVVTSSSGRAYGAAFILAAQPVLETMFPNGYYVLPSSIHEVIVVPKTYVEDSDDNMLRAMVRDVNETQVSPQEKLSDSIYSFSF